MFYAVILKVMIEGEQFWLFRPSPSLIHCRAEVQYIKKVEEDAQAFCGAFIIDARDLK